MDSRHHLVLRQRAFIFFLNFKNNTTMKNIILVLALFLTGNVLTAQNIIDENFKHLKNHDDATHINITGKLFGMAAHFQDTEDEELNEMAEFVSNIEAFQLLALEQLTTASSEYQSGMNTVKNDYDELMTIRSKDGNFSLYVDESRNVVHELVGLGTSEDGFFVFSLTGEMDLEKVGEIASEIQMEGFNKMESIKDFSVSDINIYPNPVSRNGSLTLEVPEQFENGVATVYDESGRVMTTYNINSRKQDISNNNLAPGVYIVDITKDIVSVKKKFIIVD